MRTRNLFTLVSFLITGMLGACEETPKGKEPNSSADNHQSTEVRDAWQGDYLVNDLDKLPAGQRQARVGYMADVKTFASVWQAFKPGEALPEIDFDRQLVLFTRNTTFYNRTRIAMVKLQDGLVDVLTTETMSAAPIEDKVAMASVVIHRKGVKALRGPDGPLPIAPELAGYLLKGPDDV